MAIWTKNCQLSWRCANLHCQDKIPKFRNTYSKKRNIGVLVPISTFMRLWAIYIFLRSVTLFFWRKYVDRSWKYINRSQTHECWNWDWGRDIPRKGIYKGDFRCSVDKRAGLVLRGQAGTLDPDPDPKRRAGSGSQSASQCFGSATIG
jgi:hypothetical protein